MFVSALSMFIFQFVCIELVNVGLKNEVVMLWYVREGRAGCRRG